MKPSALKPNKTKVLRFTKMQGIGNDYVYVEGFTQEVRVEDVVPHIPFLSDRHFGIGGDGVIFVLPSEIAHGQMRMFNRDGSEGEMCGNGARCCVRLLLDMGKGDNGKVTLETRSGLVSGQVCEEGIRIRMFRAPLVDSRDESVVSEGTSFTYTRVDMGNPHAVILQKNVRGFNVSTYGPPIENHRALFPNRVNVEFYEEIAHGHLFMRVWERGSGETVACGTGACAVAGTYREKKGRTLNDVRVDLLGGSLFFNWTDEGFFMRGAAERVFEGSVVLPS